MAARPPHGPRIAARPPPTVRLPPANFGSKKSGRDYPPRSAPSRRSWSCRSRVSDVQLSISGVRCGRGVADLDVRRGCVGRWLCGWEEFWFLFRVKGGMIQCFANIYLFCVFFVSCWYVNLLLVGQKDIGFCHHRIEVISFHFRKVFYVWNTKCWSEVVESCCTRTQLLIYKFIQQNNYLQYNFLLKNLYSIYLIKF
jgi:hypothetical protein